MKTLKEQIALLDHWCGLTRGWNTTTKDGSIPSVDAIDNLVITSIPEPVSMEIFNAINAVVREIQTIHQRAYDSLAIVNQFSPEKELSYWPYCKECKKAFMFSEEDAFAYCDCGTTEWGNPRPADYVLDPNIAVWKMNVRDLQLDQALDESRKLADELELTRKMRDTY